MPQQPIAHTDARQLHRKRRAFTLALVALIALTLAWQFSPLRQVIDLERMVTAIRSGGRQFGALAAIGGFAVASAIAVPLSLLTLITALAFGPALGIAYSLAGATLGGAISFQCGRLLGYDVIRRLAGPRVQHVSKRLGERGLVSAIALRMVPVAPFAAVNMVAGASAIRLRHFLLGSAIGMLPLVFFSALFAEQIVRAATQPNWLTWGFIGLTLALLAVGSSVLRRWWKEAE
ncbi:VTT domain-containing protein [Niveibacterium sp. 24ML]|uniref:TVP38/TMEM64 family protein n=1 Tax=Niveibacterium sp. 24ML TaxID=2985512 RepID=UPI00226E4987|nr:VTT domain-containing protein [Niveibacterium sp. 24ML]MCX9157150.1 VTT domain-containing protein [Niveibacterium sp. 24ML]